MINYRTHVTIKIGCKVVEEYFDVVNVEHYNTILGTPFLRKMGIILDFRSPGMIWMGNEVVLTGKVSFNELKDTLRVSYGCHKISKSTSLDCNKIYVVTV